MNTTKVKAIVVACLILVMNGSALGQSDESLKELLELSGILRNHLTMSDRIVSQFQTAIPEVPEAFWLQEQKNLQQSHATTIENRLYSIYREQMSAEEVQEVIAKMKAGGISDKDSSFMQATTQAIQYGEKLMADISKTLSRKVEEGNLLTRNVGEMDCSKYRDGKFLDVLPDGEEVRIERKGTIQYSRFGNNYMKFELTYLNNCDYTMTLLETDFEPYKAEIGNVITIHPYFIDDKVIRYKCVVDHRHGFVTYGDLAFDR
ncbi:MAG: hypothetical protein AAFV95_16495 [Bacteroidota bacterium]